jgi:phosphomannomutase/phosphoglucomutase
MQDHIFRMYDIRGIVGEELCIAQVYDCARAFALYALQLYPELTTVAVGMDGRVHSPAIKDEFIRGLQDSGLSVIFIGVCPTPVVSFSEYWLPVQAACMITASHNPKEYNGIKFFLNKRPLFNEDLQKVKAFFKGRAYLIAQTKGTYRDYSLIPEYVSFLKRLFPHLVGSDIPVVFDCGNGAVGAVLPLLCTAFEFSHASILYGEVDGTYPNHEADPSVAENVKDLQQEVFKTGSAVGIAFDGDGDRMGAVTSSGRLVPGDRLLGIFSAPLLGALPAVTVVCDAKCSSGLQEYVEQLGGRLVFSPSGHAFLRKAMEREGAVVAGELSCHFFFKDRYFGYDDGVYAALRILELMHRSKKSLDEQLEAFPQRVSSPEFRIPCVQGEGPAIVAKVIEKVKQVSGLQISTVDGVRVSLQEGWGLLRSSNTQPVICLCFESDSQKGLEVVRSFFVELLQEWYTRDFLITALQCHADADKEQD